MGRIEEALRRSGGDMGKAPLAAAQAAAFVAPWTAAAEAPEPTEKIGAEVVSIQERLIGTPAAVSRAIDPEWLFKLVIAPTPDAAVVEQFRGLAASLHRARGEAPAGTSLKVVMITSADPAEGKTLTAVNLALTLSESYRQRVILIDADLRRPSLDRLCQLPDGQGLSEGLKAPADQKLKTVQFTDTLTVLPGGRPDADPMSSLTSPRMRRILDEAAERFDWVVIDAPPIGPVADAGLLTAMVDAVLLVVRAERTACAAVQHAIEAIGRERILGVVLNATPEKGGHGYDSYYSYPRQA